MKKLIILIGLILLFAGNAWGYWIIENDEGQIWIINNESDAEKVSKELGIDLDKYNYKDLLQSDECFKSYIKKGDKKILYDAGIPCEQEYPFFFHPKSTTHGR